MTTYQSIDAADRAAAPTIPFEPAQLRPRHDGWTAERQIRFIEALAASKCVDVACRVVGMSDTSAYELRNRPCGAAFARASAILAFLTRVFGLLLSAIAVQLVVDGVRSLT